MKADARRKEIAAMLLAADAPVSGGKLAELLQVSRQIIVQDIAVLKASGYQILAMHQGYIIQESPLTEAVFKVYHTRAQTEDELSCIVDLGGTVVDVIVHHKVYGKLSAKLSIFSQHGIQQFIHGIESGKSTELMNITSGYHYHTVRAENKEILNQIETALKARGYLVEESY